MRVRSVRNLIDLPLVTLQQVHAGEIQDAWLDPAEQRLLKLTVAWETNDRPMSGPDEDLPFRQIVQLEPHQVVIGEKVGETAGLDLVNYEDGLLLVRETLLDHEVVTPSGHRFGKLLDVFFDEEDGAVLGYEVANPGDVASSILSPSTDMDLKNGEIVVPERVRTVELPSPEATEEEEDLALDEMAELPEARHESPDLLEEEMDPNAYPPAHQTGEADETPDNLLG